MILDKGVCGFEFHNEIFLDKEVRCELTDDLSLILYLDRRLLPHAQAFSFQFDSQRILIDFLDKPRAEMIMYFVSASDDLLPYLIFRQGIAPLPTCSYLLSCSSWL